MLWLSLLFFDLLFGRRVLNDQPFFLLGHYATIHRTGYYSAVLVMKVLCTRHQRMLKLLQTGHRIFAQQNLKRLV